MRAPRLSFLQTCSCSKGIFKELAPQPLDNSVGVLSQYRLEGINELLRGTMCGNLLDGGFDELLNALADALLDRFIEPRYV